MLDRILALPLGWAFAALWVIVMCRANATYWVGRSIVAGTGRTRFAAVLDSAMYDRARRLTERWGILAVPLSFATVGVQTCVQLWAGVSRMPLRLYLPAVATGCVLWAGIYATVGLAVFAAWVGAGGGWAIAGIVAVAAAVITWRHRRAAPRPPVGDAADATEPTERSGALV